MKISTDLLHYSKDSKTFSAELSTLHVTDDIGLRRFGPYPYAAITLWNPKTDNQKIFVFTSEDKDGSGEDTYGYNYINRESGLRLLLIND